MFDEIWKKQEMLMHKFDKIEHEHGLMQVPIGMPVDLNDKFYQARLRDFSQRVTCEMAEATEALQTESFEEEMADVYHFLIELMIIAGIPRHIVFSREGQDLPELFLDVEAYCEEEFLEELSTPTDPMIKEAAYNFVESLMLAINELKKKPWKANHDGRETDVSKFHTFLSDAHFEFLSVCYLSGITATDLYNSYMDKSQINDQRIAEDEYAPGVLRDAMMYPGDD